MAKKISIKCKDTIKELGLGKISLEKQERIINRMDGIVYNRLLLRIVKKMTKKDIDQMNALLKKKDKKEVNNFLDKKFPNFATILKEELINFQKEIIKEVRA